MSKRLMVGLLLGTLAFGFAPAQASHTSRVYVLHGQIQAQGLQYTASGQACVTSCNRSANPGSFSFDGQVRPVDPIVPSDPLHPSDPFRRGVGTMSLFWPDGGAGSSVRFSSLIFTPRLIVGLGKVVSGARQGSRVAVTIAYPSDPVRSASSLVGVLAVV